VPVVGYGLSNNGRVREISSRRLFNLIVSNKCLFFCAYNNKLVTSNEKSFSLYITLLFQPNRSFKSDIDKNKKAIGTRELCRWLSKPFKAA
jgi:hypothetical protein